MHSTFPMMTWQLELLPLRVYASMAEEWQPFKAIAEAPAPSSRYCSAAKGPVPALACPAASAVRLQA